MPPESYGNEYFPDDMFEHVSGLDCPCGPIIQAMPGFGGGIAHRLVLTLCPDYVPDDW